MFIAFSSPLCFYYNIVWKCAVAAKRARPQVSAWQKRQSSRVFSRAFYASFDGLVRKKWSFLLRDYFFPYIIRVFCCGIDMCFFQSRLGIRRIQSSLYGSPNIYRDLYFYFIARSLCYEAISNTGNVASKSTLLARFNFAQRVLALIKLSLARCGES